MTNKLIPDNLIDKIRERIDIVDVVGQHVKLKKSGRNYFGLCPFHSEKTPSFSVAPDKQIYYCFGCGAGGNVINFVMNIEGYDFLEAINYLADESGVQLPEIAGKSTAAVESPESAKMREAYELASKLYHYILTETKQGQEAMAYLENRGFTRTEISTFKLGYAPNSYETLRNFLDKRNFAMDLMLDAGLLSASEDGRIYDRFRDRIMFPISDEQGRVIAFGGRMLGDGEPKYLNSPDSRIYSKGKVLYNLQLAKKAIRKRNRAILFEGYVDTITAWQAGIDYGVASLGTALTDQQVLLLKRFADEVYICYDSDDAGQLATLRAIEVLNKNGLKIMIADLPTGKDPDDYIREHGADKFSNNIIKQAITVTSFRLAHLRGAYNLKNEGGRLDYLKKALEIIAVLRHTVEQEHYLMELANEFRVSLDSLKLDLRRISEKNYSGQRQVVTRGEKYGIGLAGKQEVLYPGYYNAENNLIYLMMNSIEVSKRVERELGENFHVDDFATLATKLYDYYQQGYAAEVDRFIASLEDENLRKLATRIAMSDINENITEKELNDYIKKTQNYSIQQKIDQKRLEQLEAERNKEIKKSIKIGQEIIELRNSKRNI